MVVRELIRIKLRIKSFLDFYGIEYPPEFSSHHKHWSNGFMRWLKEDITLQYSSGRTSLELLVLEADNKRKQLLDITNKVRALGRTDKYRSQMELLVSIPVIGFISAITLLTEIGDVLRFKNTGHLVGFVGLIPMSHSSGEKESKGEISFIGQKVLKSILVESSWIASRKDPA